MAHNWYPGGGVMALNGCAECLKKQREIDRRTEELQRLKQKLRYQERQATEGFFGSATPSAKRPVKASLPPPQVPKRKGARPGHPGVGRTLLYRISRLKNLSIESEKILCPKLCPRRLANPHFTQLHPISGWAHFSCNSIISGRKEPGALCFLIPVPGVQVSPGVLLPQGFPGLRLVLRNPVLP
jgi:hypothetical protein